MSLYVTSLKNGDNGPMPSGKHSEREMVRRVAASPKDIGYTQMTCTYSCCVDCENIWARVGGGGTHDSTADLTAPTSM